MCKYVNIWASDYEAFIITLLKNDWKGIKHT